MRQPKEATETISFRIPQSLKRNLEAMSDEESRTLSQQIVFLLRKAFVGIGGTSQNHKVRDS